MKLYFLLGGSLLLASTAFAQRCGTMQNLEYLKSQDPSLEARHQKTEPLQQQWIESHALKKITLPSIPGFVPTGDAAKDREAYQKAKKAFADSNPEAYRDLVKKNTVAAPQKSSSRRTQKSFHPVKSN